MAKVSGSYESVVRGVSQQVPQDRLSGQHTEQVNMVSDPVTGLARRHGSEMLCEQALPLEAAASFPVLLANTAKHRSFPFSSDKREYDLLYRSGERVHSDAKFTTLFCYDRSAAAFIPVRYDPAAVSADHPLNRLATGGVSAITQIGRYIIMAGNTITTSWQSTERWSPASNKRKIAAWVRGGAYSRTFSITLRRADGSSETFEHKTPSASYPELLDVSDLSTSDPDYQKKINDRVYAHQSETTKWIGTAAEGITPETIAAELLALYTAGGFTGATRVAGSLMFDDPQWVEIDVNDGGDGSLMIGVGNVVSTAERLCPVHFPGKVVKVQPSKDAPDLSFYMQAYASVDNAGTAPVEVQWRETAGQANAPGVVFVLATVEDGELLVASDPSWLESQIGPTNDDVPKYAVSTVGDDISAPLPNFLGKRIDYLGLFQDRLIVGSGSTLSASRTGDYFNWFRKSVLTILDTDPFDMYPLGAEEDTIRYSTVFNRDLILYGNEGQYTVSGRVTQTPKNNAVVSLARHEGGQDTPPVAAGNFVFYAKKRGPENKRLTKLAQIQPGLLADAPQGSDVSEQLDDYIAGTAIELVTITTPNAVIVRTDATRTGWWVYNYLDTKDGTQRLMDSWSRWTWSGAVGNLIGMSRTGDGDILAFVVKDGLDGTSWLACERFTTATKKSPRPYMDSLRPYTDPDYGYLDGRHSNELGVVFGEGPNHFFGGSLLTLNEEVGSFNMSGSYVGVEYPAFVTPTNPFNRDRQGRAITYGRTTLSSIKFSVADTGGCTVSVEHIARPDVTVTDFQGRLIGSPLNVVGTQPLMTTTLSAFVGGEVRECAYTIAAKRWLPLTITSIEWAGQLFNNTRRV